MLNNVNFRLNYVELWHFRCYPLCRGVLVTFRHMLYTRTGLQFCELVTKILTITSREQTTEWNYFHTVENKTIRQGTSCSDRTVFISTWHSCSTLAPAGCGGRLGSSAPLRRGYPVSSGTCGLPQVAAVDGSFCGIYSF